MSAVATPRSALRSATITDRLLAAAPLASVYLWLSGIYMVEAWRRSTPWLFGDELEFTQLSRSIAATGHAAERGQSHSPDSIYTYLIAPLWRIHDVAAAYSAVKYFDVLVMAAVIFPTYLLARLVVGKTASLFAAAGAGAIPAMAYSSYVVEEPLAYAYAALCFYLIAKALVTRGRRWIAAAILASIVALAVRAELSVIPAVLVLAAIFAAWSSEAARRWRAGWSRGDWIGAVALLLGAIFVLGAIGSDYSGEILRVTRGYKHREIVEGNWAAGTLAIGMGVLPFIAGLAALFRARGEPASREVRMFRSVSLAGIVAFGLYTAIKAAYLSTAFATRVEERNLIYIAPLLFVGTALVFSRRRVSWIGLAAAGAYTLYLVGYALYHVTQYPYQMGVQLYSDALGFAILQQGNRDLSWTPHLVREVLIAMVVISVLVLVAPILLRGRSRVVASVIAIAGLGVIGWNLTGELAAAAGTNSIARQAGATLKRPFSWVDAVTGGAPTLYIGQEEIDQNPEWLLEFWNRSITGVSSLDGTLGGPGPAGGPNFLRNGTLYSGNDAQFGSWRYAYAVEDLPCIQLVGRPVGSHPYRAGGQILYWRLVRLTEPNRMQSDCIGIYPDGWSGAKDSVYYRYSGPAGWLRVAYSRPENYPIPPTPIRITLGVMKAVDKQPVLAQVTKRIDSSIGNLQSKVAWIRVPAGGFAAHVAVAKKFVPDDYDHRGDKRQLGAQVTYRFFLTKPHR
ncbi:MAG TPA: hypothetical protein VII54_10510 [Gaiellaceae bacterium]